MLLSIQGGSDLGLFEINEAAALVASAAHEEANIIFGATIDDALGDEVRVTVIAAGFDGGMPKPRDEGTVLGRRPQQQPQQSQEETRAAVQQRIEQRRQENIAGTPAGAGAAGAAGGGQSGRTPSTPAESGAGQGQSGSQSGPAEPTRPGQGQQQPPSRQPRPVQFDDDDDLDVPDFLK